MELPGYTGSVLVSRRWKIHDLRPGYRSHAVLAMPSSMLIFSHGRDPSGVSLWESLMVLGPTPEFCVLSPNMLDLPVTLAASTSQLDFHLVVKGWSSHARNAPYLL